MSVTIEDIKKAQADLDAKSAAMFADEKYRKEIAQNVTESIYEGFRSENIVELFTETEYLPINGRATMEEVRGLQAFWTARGGYIEESFLERDVLEIEQDYLGFHVVESEDRLKTQFAETAATLIDLGISRVNTEVNKRVLLTFQDAIHSSHPNYTDGPGLSLDAVKKAVRTVKDAVPGNVGVSIIGRPTMTDQIPDLIATNNGYTGYLPETNEEMLRRGKIATFNGASIIELHDYRDGNGESFFPANELWVIGQDAGKTVFFGTPDEKEFIEDDNWYWHYIYRASVGVAVAPKENRICRIVDTSIAP